ncbi:MAG TPA: VOC family protein [Thermoplasmata archaeon]|nr:VOC family protein [Thermoplasmata archaeon]
MVEPIEGMSAVTVHVRDVQAARHFYRDVLGLKEAGFNEQSARAVYILPGNPTAFVAHVQRPGEGGREPGTVSGIVFTHQDPVAAVEEIRKRGGTITMEPVTVPGPGGGTIIRAVIADPDGNEFILSTGHR